MTQEDKELLLKDLCARLPYNVIVDYGYNAFDVHNGNYVKHGSKCILKCYLLDVFISPRQNEKGEYIKPYLRPMSSMTEEERKEVENLIKENRPSPYGIINNKGIDNLLFSVSVTSGVLTNWLNAHHFDYCGLIEKGLALEAPKGMYNKNKITCYMCEDKQYCSQSEYVKKNCYKLK